MNFERVTFANYARNPSMAAYPSLRERMRFACFPSLGMTGTSLFNPATWARADATGSVAWSANNEFGTSATFPNAYAGATFPGVNRGAANTILAFGKQSTTGGNAVALCQPTDSVSWLERATNTTTRIYRDGIATGTGTQIGGMVLGTVFVIVGTYDGVGTIRWWFKQNGVLTSGSEARVLAVSSGSFAVGGGGGGSIFTPWVPDLNGIAVFSGAMGLPEVNLLLRDPFAPVRARNRLMNAAKPLLYAAPPVVSGGTPSRRSPLDLSFAFNKG